MQNIVPLSSSNLYSNIFPKNAFGDCVLLNAGDDFEDEEAHSEVI